MKAEETDIFISYRRVDGRDIARTIQLALNGKGYENVFFDYNSMRDGMFNEQILTAIEHCKDFLLLLSPESMKRCSNEDDWVMREISAAVESGCKITPIQINEPFENWPEDFPRRYNFIKLIERVTIRTDEYFPASIERLVKWLDAKPKATKQISENNQLVLHVLVDETCVLYIDDEKRQKIKGGKLTNVAGIEKEKTYKLRFSSLARRGDDIECSYKYSNQNTSTKLEISFSLDRKQKEIIKQKKKEKDRKLLEDYYKKRAILDSACENYDSSGLVSEDGLILVSLNGKIGYLNENGLEVIQCLYNNASSFYNGYATVSIDIAGCEKWGIINTKGKIIVPFISDTPCCPNYDYTYYISSKNGLYAITSIADDTPDFKYDEVKAFDKFPELFAVRKNSSWNVIDVIEDNLVVDCNLESITGTVTYPKGFTIEYFRYVFLMLPVTIQDSCTKLYGYINSKIEQSVPFVVESYDSTGLIDYEICKIRNKYSLLNIETGEFVIPPIYEYIYRFTEISLFYCCVNEYFEMTHDSVLNCKMRYGGRRGIINLKGEIIVPINYHHIDIISWDSRRKHSDWTDFYLFICMDLSNFKFIDNKVVYDQEPSSIWIYSEDGEILMKTSYLNYINNRSVILDLQHKIEQDYYLNRKKKK